MLFLGGLGYYCRVRLLLVGVKMVMGNLKYNGWFLDDFVVLEKEIDGVGWYIVGVLFVI